MRDEPTSIEDDQSDTVERYRIPWIGIALGASIWIGLALLLWRCS